MVNSERIKLERELIEIRERMSRLRVLLRARRYSPAEKADRTQLLQYYGLVEQNLKAELEVHLIDEDMDHMRFAIEHGLSALKAKARPGAAGAAATGSLFRLAQADESVATCTDCGDEIGLWGEVRVGILDVARKKPSAKTAAVLRALAQKATS